MRTIHSGCKWQWLCKGRYRDWGNFTKGLFITQLKEKASRMFEYFPSQLHHCPTRSLNSLLQVGFFLRSSTNISNLGLTPLLILLNAATARRALRCSSAARSRSCLTVSLVTVAPFMVFSSWGVASSRRWATAAGATCERRKSIMWEMTLISSESSERPGITRSRNSWRLSFERQVSSYWNRVSWELESKRYRRTRVYIVSYAVFLVSKPSSTLCVHGPIWTVLIKEGFTTVSL